MPAEKFKEFKDTESEEEISNYFEKLTFKHFNIMVRAKHEAFQGEARVRYFAIKVFPQNLQAENKALLRRLEAYSSHS